MLISSPPPIYTVNPVIYCISTLNNMFTYKVNYISSMLMQFLPLFVELYL